MPSTPRATVTHPNLIPGLNVLETGTHRSTSLHDIVLQLHSYDQEIIWIDARNNANAQLLRHPGARRRHANIRLARAFTAYQHHELVRQLPNETSENTPVIVMPCLASLYRDDDVPNPEGHRYLSATVEILHHVAQTFDVPILATTTHADELRDVIREYEVQTITVEETGLGYRFETDDFETTVYWGDGWWQTTIPYWVELLGAVEEVPTVEYAADHGHIPATI